jgi:hypothetical protein
VITDTAACGAKKYAWLIMLSASQEATTEIQMLLARLRAFCFPGGEEPARLIRAIKTTEAGEIRTSPEARWIPFTAEQIVDSTRSSFRWEARLDPSKVTSPTVIDAYEGDHGRLTVKVGASFP